MIYKINRKELSIEPEYKSLKEEINLNGMIFDITIYKDSIESYYHIIALLSIL